MESLIRIVQSKRPLSSFFSVVPTFVPTVSAEGSTVGVAGSGSSTTGGVGSSGVGSTGVGSTGVGSTGAGSTGVGSTGAGSTFSTSFARSS